MIPVAGGSSGTHPRHEEGCLCFSTPKQQGHVVSSAHRAQGRLDLCQQLLLCLLPGDTDTAPCPRCADPACQRAPEALSTPESRSPRAPILLPSPYQTPLPEQPQSPGLCRRQCIVPVGRAGVSSVVPIFPCPTHTSSHLHLRLQSPWLKQADAVGPLQKECRVTGFLGA